jgi:hypothetical protein
MYDTVEIPLMPGASFSDRISRLKSEVEFATACSRMSAGLPGSEIPFTQNFYYRQVVDLRRTADLEAVLHLNAKKTGTHKIQILEAGRKCAGQIADTIAKIVNDHPDLLGVSRVDTCADVVDGPEVKWMAQTVRAKSAQWQAEFGTAELRDEKGFKVPWSDMGKREVQTMYIGKRPNCFRVYDKLAERRATWTREKRRHERLASEIVRDKALEGGRDRQKYPLQSKEELREFAKRFVSGGRYFMPFPDFEGWFAAQCVGPLAHLVKTAPNVLQMPLPGQEQAEQIPLLPMLPKVVTRVERQMAAGRVPESLDTFEKLFSVKALDFNPFEKLNFSSFDGATQIVLKHRGKCDDGCKGIEHYSVVEFAAGQQFRQWLETGMSYQQLYAYWNTRRNARSIAKKFAPFVAAANPAKVVSITSSELYERYRSSVSRQMAA